jgi:plasmid stabilization system protein ParE
MRELRLLPGVFDDTEQAARWYNEEGYEGLGERFVDNFYSYLQHIQQHGESYRQIYNEFRRILLYPFPYAIYYRYHENWIVISLVIHTARSPRLVRRLLKERKTETGAEDS